jgi:spore germination cell wall hydrolase CwlJ-like protein
MYEKQALNIAMDIASLAMEGAFVKNIKGATHYHTKYIKPYWVEDMFYIGEVDTHLFYRRNK